MFADRISKTINKTVQVFLAESLDFGGAIVHPQDKILEVLYLATHENGFTIRYSKIGLVFHLFEIQPWVGENPSWKTFRRTYKKSFRA